MLARTRLLLQRPLQSHLAVPVSHLDGLYLLHEVTPGLAFSCAEEKVLLGKRLLDSFDDDSDLIASPASRSQRSTLLSNSEKESRNPLQSSSLVLLPGGQP